MDILFFLRYNKYFNRLGAGLHIDGILQLGYRISVGDQGLQVQLAGGDQCHGAALGVGVDERAHDGQFLLENGVHLGLQHSLGMGHAEEHDAAAASSCVDGLLGGLGMANALDDDISAFAAQNLVQTLVQVLIDGVDGCISTQFQCQFTALFHGLAEDDLSSAGLACQLQHDLTDGTTTNDQNVLTGTDAHAVNAVEAACDGLCHCSQFGIGSLGNHQALTIRSQAVVSEANPHGIKSAVQGYPIDIDSRSYAVPDGNPNGDSDKALIVAQARFADAVETLTLANNPARVMWTVTLERQDGQQIARKTWGALPDMTPAPEPEEGTGEAE